jgi:hypothetical protein
MTDTSAIPALRAALVANGRIALPDIEVRYGYGVTDDPSHDVLMIGAIDPFSSQLDQTASSQQDWITTGVERARTEQGFISCIAMSWNGNGGEAGLQEATEGAFAISVAVESMLRANPAQGIATLEWTSYGTSQELREIQDEDGSLAYVLFQVLFKAYLL